MKKTLLLSVVASTMIMAGGDIAPVEPAVVTPAPVVESNWKFSGQAVAYYQTHDAWDTTNLFDQASSDASAGLQLTATNADLIAGIGFGAQLNGLGTLGLEEDVVSGVMQNANGALNSGYISQLYLTYGMDNTSFKVGRQELPKALSPFAYSEDWNVFTNTFNAALVVNTDIQDTVLVGAWVRDANYNALGADMNNFYSLNSSDGAWMLTAQNKSIADLTLTGSYYYLSDVNLAALGSAGYLSDDVNILWGDAQYNAGFANIGIQGGAVWLGLAGTTDTKAFGAKVSGKVFDIVNASLAYSHVNDSTAGMFNVGGTTSALYTGMVGNQVFNGFCAENDSDKFVIAANADVLGGNLAAAYGYTDLGNSWAATNSDNMNEFDLTYSTDIAKNLNLAASYVYLNDGWIDPALDTINVIRVVARYNF